jgi:tetratricopeptide (TPR) repeat protein
MVLLVILGCNQEWAGRGSTTTGWGAKYQQSSTCLEPTYVLHSEIEVTLGPGEDFNAEGRSHARAGALDEAITKFTEAMELDSGFFGEYVNRANAYYRQGKIDEALADYSEAIELRPSTRGYRVIIPYIGRAEIYSVEGRAEEAIDDYTKAIEDIPDSERLKGRAYCGRAGVYDELNKLEEAANDYGNYLEVATKKSGDQEIKPADHAEVEQRLKELQSK